MRDEWQAAVLRSPALHDRTKLVLIVLAGYMSKDGLISVGREEVAAALGMGHVQRISERCTDARGKGFLELVQRGGRGRPTIYRALLTSGPLGHQIDDDVRPTRTSSDAMTSGALGHEAPLMSGQPGHLLRVTADSNHRGGTAAAATSVDSDDSIRFPAPQASSPVTRTAPRSAHITITTTDQQVEQQRQLRELERLSALEAS